MKKFSRLPAECRRKRNRGFALVYTLWIVVILSVLLGTLGMSVRSGIKFSRYSGDALQSGMAVRSGMYRAAAEVTPKTFLGINDDLSSLNKPQTGYLLVEVNGWKVKRLEAADDKAAEKELKEGFVLCRVTAEDGKLPIKALEHLPGLKSAGVNPLVAQRVTEYLVRQSKKGTYSFTELIANGTVDYKSYMGDKKKPGLRDLLTTLSVDGKVNVNSASAGVFQLMGMDAGSAERLHQTLKGAPLADPAGFRHAPGVTAKMYKSVKDIIKVKSDLYRVSAEGLIKGIRSTYEGVFNLKNGSPETAFVSGG